MWFIEVGRFFFADCAFETPDIPRSWVGRWFSWLEITMRLFGSQWCKLCSDTELQTEGAWNHHPQRQGKKPPISPAAGSWRRVFRVHQRPKQTRATSNSHCPFNRLLEFLHDRCVIVIWHVLHIQPQAPIEIGCGIGIFLDDDKRVKRQTWQWNM